MFFYLHVSTFLDRGFVGGSGAEPVSVVGFPNLMHKICYGFLTFLVNLQQPATLFSLSSTFPHSHSLLCRRKF